MPALVLTAGLGTRLDPITRLVAKAAVPLAGRTLIERSLSRLADQGITDAILNLHHRPESVTAIVGDGAHLGLRVRYSWEPTILGSAGGPRQALALVAADTFLIVNGDTLCDVDLAAMLQTHHETDADVTMAVVPNPSPDHYNGMVVDETGRVTGFVPKGRATGTWHFVGIQVVQADVFLPLTAGQPAETVAGIYREAVSSGDDRIRAFPVTAPFLDVGTPADYLAAALALGPDPSSLIESGATVSSRARVSRSVVWAGATIGDGAELDDCVVTNVAVPPGLRLQRAVLVPAAVVRPGDGATITGDVAAFDLNSASRRA